MHRGMDSRSVLSIDSSLSNDLSVFKYLSYFLGKVLLSIFQLEIIPQEKLLSSGQFCHSNGV